MKLVLPNSRHAARSREARRPPAGGAPGPSSGAGRLISVVRPEAEGEKRLVLGKRPHHSSGVPR